VSSFVCLAVSSGVAVNVGLALNKGKQAMSLTAISFLAFTGMVAVITYLKVRRDDHQSSDGYFLGGRSLSAIVIAGSLLLTNLSTEQMVGLSGQSFNYSLSVMAWETVAAIAMVIMAVFVLPRYLKSGITTVPVFLEERYDKTTRLITSALFLVGFGIVYLPIVLYSGALALNSLFNVPELLNVDRFLALCFTIVLIAVAGGIYAIYGGLKAVAVSDTINGVGLLVGGLMIPVLGLWYLGEGNLIEGVATLGRVHSEKLSSIGAPTDPVPFSGLFTGMILINCFYWCTNQGIVQRTLGAKDLAAGQKGILIAAFFKLFGPVILVLPGIIAFHMFGDEIVNGDMAYPKLVARVLPGYLTGFFGAVLLGAILSTYNSFLNSASTLFSLDIYKELINKDATESQMVRMGKRFGTILALGSICLAPTIYFAQEGLYQWMKKLNGFYNVPVFTIIAVGMLSSRIPPIAAKVALLFGVTSYTLSQYVFKVDMHFLNVHGVLFVLNITIMILIGKLWPMKQPYVQVYSRDVDITPWRYAKLTGLAVVLTTLAIYLFFAQFAPASIIESTTTTLRVVFLSVILVLVFLAVKKYRRKSVSDHET